MIDLTPYKYVDIHRVDKGGNHRAWERVPILHLPKYVDGMIRQESKHIFSTIQMFRSPKHEEGEEYACPLYFDLDSDENLDIARTDARKLADYFFTGFDIEEGIRFYFSGNRGFHITVDQRIFNAVPANNLVRIWRDIAENLAGKLSLRSFDRSVYSKRRQWRAVNTKHGTSGLWKIELYPQELAYTCGRIREMAIGPREDTNEVCNL